MITITIPVDSRGQFTGNIFSAAFNTSTPNRYEFDGAQKSTVLNMFPNKVYVFDKIFFSANMPEGVYQEAIDDSNGLPQLILTSEATQQGVLVAPYNFINYVDNQDNILFFESTQTQNNLEASFSGLFSQPAPIVGLGTMKIFLQMTIFEVGSIKWVNEFGESSPKQGEDIPLRGGQMSRQKWEEMRGRLC